MITENSIQCKEPKPVSAVGVLACASPALLLATVCLLPFLNKPFVIDDPWFLTMAHQIVRHPAHPMDFSICWNNSWLSDGCPKAYQLVSGNPLMGQVAQGYVLLPTIWGGAHEWIAHLTQLVLVWIAVIAMTSLVLRFGRDRWHATAGSLLLVALPPFLPMANTAMPDILATALALVAIERLTAWKADRKWNQAIAAAFSLGLAGFARPHLVLLIPLAAFFLLESIELKQIVEQVRRRALVWIPVIAASCVIVILILTLRESDLAQPLQHPAVGVPHILANLFSFVAFFVFPLPLAACWLVNRLKAGKWLLICAMLGLAVPCLLLKGHPLFIFLVVMGMGVMIDFSWEAFRSRDQFNLFLALWLLIPLPIIFYVQLPMKYLLPCMPAVIFVCFRWMDRVSVRTAQLATLLLVITSTSYSLLILRSDDEFAEFGRDALHRLIAPHVAAREKVWFPGQYWSFWYAPIYGAALTYPGGPQPSPGDLLVVDSLAGKDRPAQERFPHRTIVDAVSHKYRFGRTMGAGIGLYDNGQGNWLWGFGDSQYDRFELWRID